LEDEMGRIIKFRSWNPVSRVMQYKIEDTIVGCLNDYNNIMQYPGLKDRRGVEIWEGDIVRLSALDNNEIQQVYYENKESRFKYTNREFSINCYTVEVIGNIYENPELLKGE
jgi:hypothetical protein